MAVRHVFFVTISKTFALMQEALANAAIVIVVLLRALGVSMQLMMICSLVFRHSPVADTSLQRIDSAIMPVSDKCTLVAPSAADCSLILNALSGEVGGANASDECVAC
jgi:hypothetical protein